MFNKILLLEKNQLKLNYKVKKFVLFLLLSIYLGFYGSITLFPHVHFINNVSIVHSHPLKTSADNPINNHSEDELIFIQFVTTFLITFSFIFFLSEKIEKVMLKRLFQTYKGKIPEFNSINSQGLRAPPAKYTN